VPVEQLAIAVTFDPETPNVLFEKVGCEVKRPPRKGREAMKPVMEQKSSKT